MRAFLGGLVVGAAAVAVAWAITMAAPDDGQVSVPPARALPEEPRPRAVEDDGRLAPAVEARGPARDPAPPAQKLSPFPPGEALLHVGEGYIFGEDRAVLRSESRPPDIECLEIAGGTAVIRCLRGGCLADVPLGAIGLPEDTRVAAGLLLDAPEELSPDDVRLTTRVRRDRCGVGIARAGSGRTYRIALAMTSNDPEVLSRTARLVFEEIPARPGGGVLAVSTTEAADGLTTRDVNDWIAADSRIPGASFTNFLRGSYELLRAPPAELVLRERKYLVLADALTTKIEFNRYSGLVAPHGIGTDGRVHIRSYTGVAVRGDMAGTIDVNSYAHLHVAGDLTGKVDIRSYATLVIDGDLVGEVRVGSYTTLLLRGRLLGKLDIQCSGSKFWFEQWMSRVDAEALGGCGNDLHLRSSDVSDGTYTDWKDWGSAKVGEEAWRVIAK